MKKRPLDKKSKENQSYINVAPILIRVNSYHKTNDPTFSFTVIANKGYN